MLIPSRPPPDAALSQDNGHSNITSVTTGALAVCKSTLIGYIRSQPGDTACNKNTRKLHCTHFKSLLTPICLLFLHLKCPLISNMHNCSSQFLAVSDFKAKNIAAASEAFDRFKMALRPFTNIVCAGNKPGPYPAQKLGRG